MHPHTFHPQHLSYQIYRELAQQKKEKSDREAANGPKERDYDKEQKAAIEKIRLKEEESGER